jgi:cobaltochelatase CobS
MATKQELQQKLTDLIDALDAVPDEFKGDIQKEIDETQAEIDSLNMVSTPSPTPSPVPAQQMPQMGGASSPILNSIVSTMANMMTMAGGSGADNASVMALIDKYRKENKIKLDELDAEILEEIKKNQTILLQIPEFSKPIEINRATALIPNFFDIIDDVLAGNNVYLIGEAGGGKTYTAEQVSKTLKRDYVTLNCSQYTSPLEILGGQSVDGFKQGKLIDCWKKGKILIMDEMPKLDPNTAGLFNDALAKSSKTRPDADAKINSANPDEAPIERAKDFAIIATGNIYPNQPPPPQYRGNNQQDLSLLDRFSGSVYYTEFDNNTDQETTRFNFLYGFLIGNYYDYINAKKNKLPLPTPRGLRTIIDANNLKNLSLVSYRTNISFRVAFEFELVRAIAKKNGQSVVDGGKTLLKTFKSYMVAFRETTDAYDKVIRETGYTDAYIQNMVDDVISKILSSGNGFLDSLNPLVKQNASKIYGRYEDFYVGQAEIKP